MLLKYAKVSGGNVGDDLNQWLWPRIFPNFFDDDDSELFLGIGTILHKRYPSDSQKVVFTSGAGYRRPPVVDHTWKIFGVRGKLTAGLMEIPEELAVGDGAYLLRNFVDRGSVRVGMEVGFVPHHGSRKFIDWQNLCAQAGLRYIDPGDSPDNFIAQIQGCRKVICEAMHGAIIADALRVPWVPYSYSHRFLEWKWRDWLSVFDLDPEFVRFPQILQYPLEKRVQFERMWKSFLKHVPLTPSSWNFLPYRVSSPQQIENAIVFLEKLKSGRVEYLTSDRDLERVEAGLLEGVERIRAAYV